VIEIKKTARTDAVALVRPCVVG